MPTRSRCKILIADDAEAIRSLVRLYLEQDGRFEVVGEAGNGQQAIDAAATQDPDIVLLDISMPVLDGLQALPRIRAMAPASKVVILSGLDDPDIKASALAAGAQRFLVKTSNLNDVVEEVAALCPGDDES